MSMDKQKSYGKNYEQTKLKHKFSLKFALGTLLACGSVAVCIGIIFGVL